MSGWRAMAASRDASGKPYPRMPLVETIDFKALPLCSRDAACGLCNWLRRSSACGWLISRLVVYTAICQYGFKPHDRRSEEHTSELQSLMRIPYAVFCLEKKKTY